MITLVRNSRMKLCLAVFQLASKVFHAENFSLLTIKWHLASECKIDLNMMILRHLVPEVQQRAAYIPDWRLCVQPTFNKRRTADSFESWLRSASRQTKKTTPKRRSFLRASTLSPVFDHVTWLTPPPSHCSSGRHPGLLKLQYAALLHHNPLIYVPCRTFRRSWTFFLPYCRGSSWNQLCQSGFNFHLSKKWNSQPVSISYVIVACF